MPISIESSCWVCSNRGMIRILAFLVFASSAVAQLRPWDDYHNILWMSGGAEKHKDHWPLVVQRLKEMGINTGMGHREEAPQPLVDSGFGYYVENIINKGLCLKFSSKVTNWSKFVDEWAKTRSPEAFVRDYCFDDPKWLGDATSIMAKAAAVHAPSHPLAYDLRDELSVTTSANPFDYDFSPLALEGFRTWLKTQYSSLQALNTEWDTDFTTWEEVMPFSTDQIKRRMVTGERMPKGEPDWSKLKGITLEPEKATKDPVRWNFAPWCDHRTYMDISLARTLDALRQASHSKDPATPVGIEGTQMPSAFGGYDLNRLSQALDWMEPYDVGNSREILGSFMPGKPLMATVFEKDTNAAMRRLWHLLLLGDRGCIVWWSEDIIDWSKPDLPLTAKGQALAPALKAMTTSLAKLFLLAQREFDPIGIYYSQPSVQVAWLMESTVDGKTWPRRFSSFESTHSQHAQIRNSWLKLFQDLGYSPQFVTSEKQSPALQVVVYPQTLAYSAKDKTRQARLTLADAGAGLFDEHGKLKFMVKEKDSPFAIPEGKLKGLMMTASPALVTGSGVGWKMFFVSTNGIPDYAGRRLTSKGAESDVVSTETTLKAAGISPPVRVPAEARVRVHRFTLGKAKLLAFERNIDYKMSEDLKQAGGNAELEKPVTFKAEWDEAKEVVDLRTGKSLGKVRELEVHLDPWQPSLFALLPEPVNGDVVEALLKGH